MPSAPPDREDPQAEQRRDAHETRAGRAGERSVGDRMRHERRAAHDDEEADRAADRGHERGDDPGVDHEAAEHGYGSPTVLTPASPNAGEQIAEQHQRDDEEADRPATMSASNSCPRRAAMPSHVQASPMPAATSSARCGRLVRRRAVAAGPTSSAVDRIAPIVEADRRNGHRHRHQVGGSDQAHRDSAGGGQLRADADQQQRPVERDDGGRGSRPETQHEGRLAEEMAKIEPNRIDGDLAGCAVVDRAEVEEQGGQAKAGAEHDPGGQIASPSALYADQLHHRRGRHARAQ